MRERNGGPRWLVLLGLLPCLAACSSGLDADDLSGVSMRLDPSGGFFDMPYPANDRLDRGRGVIDLDDFPNPNNVAPVAQIVALAGEERSGFARNPVVHFGFDAPIAADRLPQDEDMLPEGPVAAWFVNIDPAHPDYGQRLPVLAAWFERDGTYVPANTLTLMPWPGLSLWPDAEVAAVVLRELGDAEGRPLGQAPALTAALAGRGQEPLRSLYAPLAAWLDADPAAPAASAIAAATVFRTAHPAAELRALVEQTAAAASVTVSTPFALAIEGDRTDYCLLEGRLRFPQYQRGEAPFAEADSGRFEWGSDGRPVRQGDEDVRTVLVVPKGTPMPAAGWPLLEYVHGSGGIATQLVDRGPKLDDSGENTPWEGPAWWAARRGMASSAHAMPISPDRVPSASDFDYLQLANLVAVRDNFRQGMIELALKQRWLRALTLPAALCPGADIPGGQIRFNLDRHATMGHSMGAMYANMFAAISPGTRANIPTGSGGYWSYFIFTTDLIPGAAGLLRNLMGVPSFETWGPLHPLMGLFQQFVEKVDPVVFAPHVIQNPLPGVPAKHMLLTFGDEDVYFSPRTQRAMSLAYGVPLAGDEVVPGTAALLAGLLALEPATLPAEANLAAGDGSFVTAAQTQWLPDLPHEPNGHNVVFQYPTLMHQVGCFLADVAAGKTPVFRAPANERFAACD